jgi:transporter family-2 protein
MAAVPQARGAGCGLHRRDARANMPSAWLRPAVPCLPQDPMPQDPMTQQRHPAALPFLAAFGTGGLLTLMVHFNGTLAAHGTALFASWAAHGTGTVVALILLLTWRRLRTGTAGGGGPAPLWAYAGGASGAVTVMLTSVTVNSALALSGTLALGLAGQMLFSLAADRWGMFDLPRRNPDRRDLATIGLIVAGSLVIIFGGQG